LGTCPGEAHRGGIARPSFASLRPATIGGGRLGRPSSEESNSGHGGSRRPLRRRLSILPSTYACPECASTLVRRQEVHVCPQCGRRYPILDGIPLFVDASLAAHDELEHLGNEHRHAQMDAQDAHKAAQSAYFDRTDLAEFEIERPSGSCALYEYLLTEKFRRSVAPLGGRLDGWSALVVCGGSGMDAEFLARSGAEVVTSDISLGAAERVRERGRRHNVGISPIVADVEHLPFFDQAFDLVYVHDGLHHLEDPMSGMREMARVARRAVAVTEPARAAATAAAVRVGAALEREEAGNRVARLELREAAAELEAAGFTVVRAARYAMFYRHVPGRVMSLLSRKMLLPSIVTAWRLADRLIGRFGNKLTIVARRDTA
jgi:ubiquinone/menaquinone biosynthesis C-methylase UbiE/uncharacterized protein YbaR (Trm112 family)